jgi:hypothetical protein
MRKSLLTITAVVAILSAGSLVSDRAKAGASASAPSKYGNGTQTAAIHQVRTGRFVRNPGSWTWEYSSSSARNSRR